MPRPRRTLSRWGSRPSPARVLSRTELVARLRAIGHRPRRRGAGMLQLTHAGYQSDARAAERASPRARGPAPRRSRHPRRPSETRHLRGRVGAALDGIAPELDRAEALARKRANRRNSPVRSIARDTPTTRSKPRCGRRADRSKMSSRLILSARRTSKNRDITTKTPMTSKAPTTRRREHSAAA